ncbi:RNA-binding transcriptional accessory protein [Pedobacter sp. MC2016-14]|uniref:Tex family protein n=1 Tax=Pedobacter sp. MC2016-14 TaxID=2897327 RepID=UPI001E339A7D|nr:Tex family protein [Pedobacter sp. MC2016-14]MCD0487153.1 RNA-binding transcriptional accessory protein [Pedobacter sp. MC2016-14]
MGNHSTIIAAELVVAEQQVLATIDLLEGGATVPFVARYRKEMTGGLDEVQIALIRDRSQQLKELDKRREAILKALSALDKLSPELEKQILEATSITVIEDLYLPYKPKRKTRASEARKKGLEPLALEIFKQGRINPETAAQAYLNGELGLQTIEDVLSGARDILAEMINEDAEMRGIIRKHFLQKARLKSTVVTGKEADGHKYKDYFDWEELMKTAPSHRLLAIFRAENEGFLKIEVMPAEQGVLSVMENYFIKGFSPSSAQVKLAIQDSYKRLMGPSMENEVRNSYKELADIEAIRVFTENARQLLLAAPLGQKNVLAIDPGFRTGCKIVCLDKQGKLLYNNTIYPHTGGDQKKPATVVVHLCEKYNIEAIAVGNGTAGRETEAFIKGLDIKDVPVVMVNESGASIYSASETAREEFPDQDITVRGAVSIGRRLLDPLAELVKIDPKSIGVGQYQHDVDQAKLQASLDDTVMSCVNSVGVELNTASKQLLAYVSGIGPQLAQNIVEFRNKNGAFKNRESLRQVPRLGDKAFEQAAGFLRIADGEQLLDASAVHPERYALVHKMARDLNCSINSLVSDKALLQAIEPKKYVTDEIGLPTLTDILSELAKPGRDPRGAFEAFSFTPGVNKITDLKVGMKLAGIITNITNFGAFVDIGVHQDGLVHISLIAERSMPDVSDILKKYKIQQRVDVVVNGVDVERKRISLGLPNEAGVTAKNKRPAPAKTHDPKQQSKAVSRPREVKRQDSRPVQKPKATPDGDLQMKLSALKELFKS